MGGNKKLETWVIENRSMLGMRQRHARQRREQTNLLRWRSQGDSTSQASCGGVSLSPRKTVGLGNLANPRRVHFKAGAMLINSRIEPYSTINEDRASASLIKRSRRDPPKETHTRGTPPTPHFRRLLLIICKQLLATLRFDFCISTFGLISSCPRSATVVGLCLGCHATVDVAQRTKPQLRAVAAIIALNPSGTVIWR